MIKICTEYDCAMLKRRRETTGAATSIHLAMDVAGPYPITSTGNQYCLMVGCYFSKRLECFPIPDQKAKTVARKLVYEIVARYGAFQELHSDQGTNFGSKVVLEVCRLFGIHKTRTTPYHPRSNGFRKTKFQDTGLVPESGVPGDKAGVGRARATHPDRYCHTSLGGASLTLNRQTSSILNEAVYLLIRSGSRSPLSRHLATMCCRQSWKIMWLEAFFERTWIRHQPPLSCPS